MLWLLSRQRSFSQSSGHLGASMQRACAPPQHLWLLDARARGHHDVSKYQTIFCYIVKYANLARGGHSIAQSTGAVRISRPRPARRQPPAQSQPCRAAVSAGPAAAARHAPARLPCTTCYHFCLAAHPDALLPQSGPETPLSIVQPPPYQQPALKKSNANVRRKEA